VDVEETRMLDPEHLIRRLAAAEEAGESRDALLREAVERIDRAEDRFNWVGIYLLEGDELVLHNYIGRPTEHTRIPVGVGVCGAAVAQNRDIKVDDVSAEENYLACSIETKSELVVLIRSQDGTVHGQIDLDSDQIAGFTSDDEAGLREIANWLAMLFA
jgi:GAF domain-containing protein